MCHWVSYTHQQCTTTTVSRAEAKEVSKLGNDDEDGNFTYIDVVHFVYTAVSIICFVTIFWICCCGILIVYKNLLIFQTFAFIYSQIISQVQWWVRSMVSIYQPRSWMWKESMSSLTHKGSLLKLYFHLIMDAMFLEGTLPKILCCIFIALLSYFFW